MAKNTLPDDAPVWVTKNRQIKDLLYCCDFLSRHPLKYINEKFYTVDGLISAEGALKQEIFDEISEWKESLYHLQVDIVHTVESQKVNIIQHNMLLNHSVTFPFFTFCFKNRMQSYGKARKKRQKLLNNFYFLIYFKS